MTGPFSDAIKKELLAQQTPDRHSKVVGGSTAKRVLACPASRRLCEGAPESGSSDAADRGTCLHNAAALMVQGTADSVGQLIGHVKYGKFVLDEAMVNEALLPALETYDSILDNVFGPNDPLHLLVETEGEFPGIPEAFGTSDICVRGALPENRDTTLIMDWKFGHFPVDAEENSQGLFYACALRNARPEMFDDEVKHVGIYIIQPSTEEGYSEWWTTQERMDRFEVELQAAVNSPDNTAIEGEHCQFAPCALRCPLKVDAVKTALSTDLDSPGTIKNLDALLPTYLDMAERVTAWARRVRDVARHSLDNGGEVAGWMLSDTKGHRTFKPGSEAEIRRIARQYGINPDTAPELLSVAQLEKRFRSNKVKLDPIKEYIAPRAITGKSMVRDDGNAQPTFSHLDVAKALAKLTSHR